MLAPAPPSPVRRERWEGRGVLQRSAPGERHCLPFLKPNKRASNRIFLKDWRELQYVEIGSLLLD